MNAKQLRNSILQMAIEGKLVPQDPNDEPASVLLDKIREEKKRMVKEGVISLSKPEKKSKIINEGSFDIPSNWTWCGLNDIIRVFGRIGFRGYTKNDLRNRKEDGAISISPSNMLNGKMDYSSCTYISEEKYEESPEIKVNEGDILIVKTGSSYGKTVLVKKIPWKSTINPQIAVIKDIAINREYLTYFLQSPIAQSKFKEFVLGTSIPTFSQANLINMEFPLPPLAEQHRIVAKIEELLPKVEEYGKAQEALDKLNEELPEKLRKSILQEAIQGRLVSQDPKDEPAFVLLHKIREEKKKRVKEGKLKKKDLEEKPISEDEKPFEIPETWEWCRLGWIGDWGAGATPSKGNSEYYDNGTIPWLRTGELNNGIVYDSEIKVTPKALEKCSLRMCDTGDVLIAMYGATIGKVAIAGIKLTTNQACCACTPYGVYNKFLMYYLMASKKTFIEMGEGGAQPNISRQKIVAFLCPLPPLAEQHRIVAKIEELLSLVNDIKSI